MTDCSHCARAKHNPIYGGVTTCLECRARAIANDKHYQLAAEAGAILPDYRAALLEAFGEDWKAGHEMVKAWAEKISTTKGQP